MKFYTHFHRTRNKILLRGWHDGKRISKVVNYKPYLFIPSNNESKYKTIHGNNVDKINFDSFKDARDFIERYKDVANFKVYGLQDFEYVFINDFYSDEIEYDAEMIRIAPLDIEVASDAGFPDIQLADKPVTAISFVVNDDIQVFGCGEYTPHQNNITYHICKNERQLLIKFVNTFSTYDVDVITGWNTEFFDIPYLINRMRYLFGEVEGAELFKKLSPWKIVRERKVMGMRGEQQTYDIVGISHLDYLPVYKKFSWKEQESYKLDQVAYHELGKKKVDYSEYESLLELYKKNHQKFIEYNIRDITLLPELETEKRFLEQIFGLAYDAKVNFNDALTTVRMWDVIIHNYLIQNNIVIEPQKRDNAHPNIMGGHVKNPVPGKYEWVVSFDLTSLYPMLIQQYNISPDTILEYIDPVTPLEASNGAYWQYEDILQKDNATITPNGCVFTRQKQGFLPALMEKIFDQRTHYKKEMLKVKQEVSDVKAEIQARGLKIDKH